MPHPPDPLARAYAILGLSPDCSFREASRRYRRLVRQWHPDQYRADPQGQAEAELRMRQINGAFEAIEQSRGRGSATPVAPPDDTPRAQPTPVGRRLTRTEIDAIADALGAPRYAAVFGRLLTRALCLSGGLIMLFLGTQRSTRM